MLNERMKIAPVLKSAVDYGGGKQTAGIYVGGAHKATFIILAGNVTDAEPRVTVAYGTDQGADVGDMAAVNKAFRTTVDIEGNVCDALTAVAYAANQIYWEMAIDNDRMWVYEVDVSAIPAGNTWIALDFGTQATILMLTGICIVESRYKPSESIVRAA